jgi:hypothetical protein
VDIGGGLKAEKLKYFLLNQVFNKTQLNICQTVQWPE